MTVSTTDNRVAYLGNGTTKDFPFRNRFLADADIVVLQKNNTTGVITTKTLTTDYTLAGATGAEGGPATVLVAPPTGTSLIVYRDPVMTQPLDLVNGVPLNVETGPETGFDRAMLQAQRVKDMYDRTMRLHDGNDTVLDTILAPAVADQVFAWSSDVASVVSGVLVNLSAYTVSPLITTMLDDATAVIARGTLGAVGTTGNETVAGVKAFTGANTHTGAETHTGIETFPTAVAGTNTTQVATTAFIPAALPTNWIRAGLVGSGSVGAVGGLSALTTLNGTDVAFIAPSPDELSTYRFDGTTWALVGVGLVIASGVTALAALNGTDVAFIDNTNSALRTYRFDGTNWAQVGNSLAIAAIGFPALAALNTTDVAFVDAANDSLRTYRFDGTNWALVGAGLSIAGLDSPALTALNGTDVAFYDRLLGSLRTYRFDGTTWTLVGASLFIEVSFVTNGLAAVNGTDVAFADDLNNSLRTYRFNGSTWAQVGAGLAISPLAAPAITALNGTDVAIVETSAGTIKTYRFAFDIGN